MIEYDDSILDPMSDFDELMFNMDNDDLVPKESKIDKDDIRLDPENGDQMTTREISLYLGITPREVLKAERRAMKKLKNNKLMYKLYLENIVYP